LKFEAYLCPVCVGDGGLFDAAFFVLVAGQPWGAIEQRITEMPVANTEQYSNFK